MSQQQHSLPFGASAQVDRIRPADIGHNSPALHREARRTSRLTVAAGVALLVIMALHSAVFAPHEWWDAWLAGPFRAGQPPLEATVLFWALPGGFVVPGALLGLLLVREGRRGGTMPLWVPIVLGAWAIGCVWIVGPSGFLTLSVPVVLLLIAGARAARARRAAPDSVAR
ncbi:hypothetical protein [Agrococcus sp. ARC_14]|uniref:hypothetical protein n=1 Tax=Agrococcus sp. ARC_14 TaxID=2919927 RepID=UPI001F068700|nr:hypothetical protein [Agrococcus sp. ARC_14]MCH1881889.1 hypothetical protein [Agrococcus sp. ARC_14]